MAETDPRPWDQQPGEPDEKYARFLTYRNLGPGRTLALAEAAHDPTAPKRSRTLPASGQWKDDSAGRDWVARAVAWDVHTLKEQGAELSRLWLAILVSAARRAAEALADPDCRPTTFGGALSVLAQLAPYMTPDVLRALQPAAEPPGDAPRPSERTDVK